MFSWQGMVLLIGTLIALFQFAGVLAMFLKSEKKEK